MTIMIDKNAVCRNCKYWERSSRKFIAECRRHSPAVWKGNGRWPVTFHNDFCGDFDFVGEISPDPHFDKSVEVTTEMA